MALPGEWAVLVAAIGTLAVAAFVLFVDFGQRVHRAFALFLVLRAMLDGFLFFHPSLVNLAGRLRMYWYIAAPFAALHFALAYRRRHGSKASPHPAWGVPLTILAVALAFEVAYLVDHKLTGTAHAPGPFLAFVSLRWLVYGAVALVFAVEWKQTDKPNGRRALELAAFGMAVAPLFVTGYELLDSLEHALAGNAGPLDWLGLSGLLSDVATFALLLETGRRFWLAGGSGRVLFGIGYMAVFSAIAVTVIVFGAAGPLRGQDALESFFAVWSLALPICVTYALVKHRLFDAEVKLRFAVKGTTLAAAFVAVFLIVDQVVQALAGQRIGGIGGAVAAGLLLFAIQPLQHWADRIARKAVPGGKSAPGTHAERVQLYREQLEIAWADGRLTTKERLLFARLQERLAIPPEEALRLETEVLSTMGTAKPRRRRGRAAPL